MSDSSLLTDQPDPTTMLPSYSSEDINDNDILDRPNLIQPEANNSDNSTDHTRSQNRHRSCTMEPPRSASSPRTDKSRSSSPTIFIGKILPNAIPQTIGNRRSTDQDINLSTGQPRRLSYEFHYDTRPIPPIPKFPDPITLADSNYVTLVMSQLADIEKPMSNKTKAQRIASQNHSDMAKSKHSYKLLDAKYSEQTQWFEQELKKISDKSRLYEGQVHILTAGTNKSHQELTLIDKEITDLKDRLKIRDSALTDTAAFTLIHTDQVDDLTNQIATYKAKENEWHKHKQQLQDKLQASNRSNNNPNETHQLEQEQVISSQLDTQQLQLAQLRQSVGKLEKSLQKESTLEEHIKKLKEKLTTVTDFTTTSGQQPPHPNTAESSINPT